MSAEPNDASLLEGLFGPAIDVSPELAAALAEKGFDRRRVRPRYSDRVFEDCLEVGWRHRFPTLPREQAFHALGRGFVEGFRQTILGKVLTVALPLVGPNTLLNRVPGRLRGLRADMVVSLGAAGEGRHTLVVRDTVQVGDFFAGVLETALGLSGAKASVTCTLRPDGYVLEVTLNRPP